MIPLTPYNIKATLGCGGKNNPYRVIPARKAIIAKEAGVLKRFNSCGVKDVDGRMLFTGWSFLAQ
jgi:hypothetical protein